MSLNSMRIAFHHTGKWILGVVTLAMLATAFTGIGANLMNSLGRNNAAQAPAQTASTAVATVNGEPITRMEYDRAYEQMKQYSGGNTSPIMAGQTRTQALTQDISATIAYEVARQAGIIVTDADIAKARDAQLAGLKEQLGLKASASVDDVNSALAKFGSATVTDLFPDNILRKTVSIQKYQDQLKKTVVATDASVHAYYHKAHTRHILISNQSRPDAQAKAQAQNIIKKLRGGADFAALAKQYSDDPGSKNKGGDDGFIDQSTPYVPEFLKAAMALQKGQTTPEPVLSSQYGYFVIQAIDTKDELPKDYDKNKAKYQQQVAQSLQGQTMQQAFEAASKSAKVVVNDPLLRAYRTMSEPPTPGQTPASVDASVAADFKKALANADYATKGEIYAQLAMLDSRDNKTADEIGALKQALNSTEDAQLRMMLGDAYRKSGNVAAAKEQYAIASKNAYDDPSVHVQLAQAYKQMNDPQLAAAETGWMKAYAARQKTANAAPSAAPITAMPSGAKK